VGYELRVVLQHSGEERVGLDQHMHKAIVVLIALQPMTEELGHFKLALGEPAIGNPARPDPDYGEKALGGGGGGQGRPCAFVRQCVRLWACRGDPGVGLVGAHEERELVYLSPLHRLP
jgi:hypothetical protein